jgi:Scaffold protein Nfu/NifU N terminal
LVGPGEGWWRHELDAGFVLEFGWRSGAFRIELSRSSTVDESFDATFDGAVVPEATPNPRTIRFVTGPIHDGPSRWYESAVDVDDPRVAGLFGAFEDVDNVLVGPDFIAVGLRRPDRWPALLVPVLRFVEAQFAGDAPDRLYAPLATLAARSDRPAAQHAARDSAVQRAWRVLGSADQARISAALSSPNIVERQVAARRVGDAEPEIARDAWAQLLDDPSRTVRRAAVDAMVDAEREMLRPLLERALLDTDAWIRWKALVGLAALGIDPSRDAVTPLAGDTDFRVRLEATRALRSPPMRR